MSRLGVLAAALLVVGLIAAPVALAGNDGDSYRDSAEAFTGTDPEDACPEPDVDPDPATEYHEPGDPYIAGDNAWPPDVNNDGQIDLMNDIFGVMLAFGSTTERSDVKGDGTIDLMNDIFEVFFKFGHTCAQVFAYGVASGGVTSSSPSSAVLWTREDVESPLTVQVFDNPGLTGTPAFEQTGITPLVKGHRGRERTQQPRLTGMAPVLGGEGQLGCAN